MIIPFKKKNGETIKGEDEPLTVPPCHYFDLIETEEVKRIREEMELRKKYHIEKGEDGIIL